MKTSIALVGLVTLNLVACAPRTPESVSSKGTDGSVAREHCLTQSNNASCFLEIESEGASKFYAPARDYSALLANPVIADMNLPMKEVPTESYAELVNKHGPTTVVYKQDSASEVEAFANTSLADSPSAASLNGWWSDFFRKVGAGIKGSIGGAITGFGRGKEQGSAYSGPGKVIGAIGGTIVGTIQGIMEGVKSVNGKAQLNYHFGNETIKAELTIEK